MFACLHKKKYFLKELIYNKIYKATRNNVTITLCIKTTQSNIVVITKGHKSKLSTEKYIHHPTKTPQ